MSCVPVKSGIAISIHAPREGGDLVSNTISVLAGYFNPRPPRGGRPYSGIPPTKCDTSISIHAPREGGDDRLISGFWMMTISIHAPREGGDYVALMEIGSIIISIHAPREGGDARYRSYKLQYLKFQSTPPARGATSNTPTRAASTTISIHAPREGGDAVLIVFPAYADISIHAPREGGDFPGVASAMATQ